MNANVSLGKEANVLGCDNVSREKSVKARRSSTGPVYIKTVN